MTRWTHYWTRPTVDDHRTRSRNPGSRTGVLDHTASNLFGPRMGKVESANAKVQPGDAVYCINYSQRESRVLGRLIVGGVVGQRAANTFMAPEPAWPARWHLLALAGSAMPMQFDTTVALDDVKRIEFVVSGGVAAPKLVNGWPDRQTFRGVREISANSAMLFDRALRIA